MGGESTRVPEGQEISEKRIKELSKINSTYEAAHLARMVMSLRSELAAIRDAGDEAILSLGGLYQQADTFYQRLQICGTIQEIAVARGARVRELEGKVECLKDSCLILEFFRPSLRASIESIIKHERHHLKRTDDEIRSGVAAGMRNAVGENSMDWIASLQSQIDSLTAERDEAIELLKLLVSFLPSYVMDDLRACSVCSAVDSIDTERTSGFKRILELTAK